MEGQKMSENLAWRQTRRHDFTPDEEMLARIQARVNQRRKGYSLRCVACNIPIPNHWPESADEERRGKCPRCTSAILQNRRSIRPTVAPYFGGGRPNPMAMLVSYQQRINRLHSEGR